MKVLAWRAPPLRSDTETAMQTRHHRRESKQRWHFVPRTRRKAAL